MLHRGRFEIEGDEVRVLHGISLGYLLLDGFQPILIRCFAEIFVPEVVDLAAEDATFYNRFWYASWNDFAMVTLPVVLGPKGLER